MSTQTSIEWTDVSWNPVRGCSKVSAGCQSCYAMRQAHRFSGPGKPYEGLTHVVKGKGPQWTGAVRTVPELLEEPLRWRRPRRVFVNSMSDLFHEDVPDSFIDEVFAVMAVTPQHTYQVLTKRPERMEEWAAAPEVNGRVVERIGERGLSYSILAPWPLPNVWLGTSVEDQAAADERIPHLLRTPAAVRFLSCEPLLGPVDLERIAHPWGEGGASARWLALLHWVIAGGESGHRARPMHPAWVRSLRDQCVAGGVPFFFKQWGAWRMWDERAEGPHLGRWGVLTPSGRLFYTWSGTTNADPGALLGVPTGSVAVARVGKRLGGRDLDGRTWDQFPTLQEART